MAILEVSQGVSKQQGILSKQSKQFLNKKAFLNKAGILHELWAEHEQTHGTNCAITGLSASKHVVHFPNY